MASEPKAKPVPPFPSIGIVNISAHSVALPMAAALELTKLLAKAVPVSYKYSEETYELEKRRTLGTMEILGQDASNKFAMDTSLILDDK